MFPLEKPSGQRPLGLLHPRRLFTPAYLEGHQRVVVHVHVPQPYTAHVVNFVDSIRAQIPNIDAVDVEG